MDTTKSLSFGEFLDQLVEGEAAAQEVVDTMLDVNAPRAVKALNKLGDYNIRGLQIWYVYQDLCRFNTRVLFDKIEDGSIAKYLETTPTEMAYADGSS